MLGSVAARTTAVLARKGRAAKATLSTYSPAMVEQRLDEEGSGGRSSNAGLKVALFGASGFLGNYVTAELGACI